MLKYFLSLFFSQRGEAAITPGGDSPPNPAPPAEPQHWAATLPDDLTYEHQGKPVPIKSLDSIKQIKDVGTLAKGYLDSQSEIGRRVRFPGKDASTEDRAAFNKRLVEGGYLPLIPDKPESYALELPGPDRLPAGVALPEESVNAFRNFAHGVGLTNEQANKLVGFEIERLGGMANQQIVEKEAGMAALKKDWGADFDSRAEVAARAGAYIFQQDKNAQEFLDRTGIGSHPAFIRVMELVGRGLQEDDGFIQSRATVVDSVQSKLAALTGANLSTAERGKLPYWDRNHTDHDKAVADAYELQRQITPGRIVE